MPPRLTFTKKTELVKTGPKEVIGHPSRHGKREQGERPTTTRALVLRKEAMGKGEVVLMSKITGREKLDLLAEDLIKQMKQAVMTPFRLEESLKIAEAQFGLYRDDIVNLKDADLCRRLLEDEYAARHVPTGQQTRPSVNDLAKTLANRIHNSYMLASAWKIVTDLLNSLADDGITNKNIKLKLKNDEKLRSRYLVLYEMVNKLVEMSHSKLSVLTTTSPHYAPYFKAKPDGYCAPGQQEVIFDWGDTKLRSVTESFLDSIIIELCFPRSPYPRSVLYQLLKDCMEESPKEFNRIPQGMANALGDLSFSVQLQAYLEASLAGPDGEEWKKQKPVMPEEYEAWVDAIYISEKVSNEFNNWKDRVYPLDNLQRKNVLDTIWKIMNSNFEKSCGENLDTLWKLQGALDITPQWTAFYKPQSQLILSKLAEESEDESDDEYGSPRVGVKSRKKKALAITDGNDSTGSMPPLQSVSNSSDEDPTDYLSSSEEETDSDYESDDNGYNTEEEDEIRDLIREAMDAGHEIDWNDTDNFRDNELDPLREDVTKGNPFLKMLGSLRGRLFNASPKIKVETERTEPRPARRIFRATPAGVKEVPTGRPTKPTPASPQAQPSGAQKATMEEVEDEDAAPESAAKKKKKKKPKKKKTGDSIASNGAVPQSPTSPTQKIPSVPPSPSVRRSSDASASTFNIPVETTHAQSAHSYLRTLEEAQKQKTKSRPDHASIFSNQSQEAEKAGLFTRIKKGLQKQSSNEGLNAKFSYFSKLSRKGAGLMRQLLKPGDDAKNKVAGMRWDSFVKLMKEMGFKFDPSTAGSSVRFDPPNPNDKPITIHKPHPDSTLAPHHLRDIGKRLKKYYGWDEEDFLKQTLG